MEYATNKEIKELLKLRIEQQKEDWNREYKDINNFKSRTETFLNIHLNKDLFILTTRLDNHIIATCGLQIFNSLPQCNDQGKIGVICNVYTYKLYRNKGIQTNLFKQAIKVANKYHLNELFLSSNNDQAISIYQKLGFKKSNMIMRLDLKSISFN